MWPPFLDFEDSVFPEVLVPRTRAHNFSTLDIARGVVKVWLRWGPGPSARQRIRKGLASHRYRRLLSSGGGGEGGTRQPMALTAPCFSVQLNYRDCEKAVKKYHIDGARFLVSSAQFHTLKLKMY